MREIKFRAIRKGSKEFLFGDLVHNCEGDAIFPSVLDDNAMLNSPDYYTIDSNTIGQFTGLRDKNGNEIYEGDILDYPEVGKEKFRCFVDFVDGCFVTRKSKSDNDLNPLYTMKHFKVIGNIHQHPELLRS